MTTGEIVAIIGISLTIISTMTGVLIWISKRMIEIGKLLSTIDMMTTATKQQVVNTHDTNLRDDITSIQYTVRNLGEKLDKFMLESRTERSKLWQAVKHPKQPPRK